MADGVYTITWRLIDSSVISTTIPAINEAVSIANGSTVAVTSFPYARYQNPIFAGITVANQSGGQGRWVVCFAENQVGNKVMIYVNFSATWYEVEIQIWKAGCWTIQSPTGSGPSKPNNIIFGTPVPIFENFLPNERPTDCTTVVPAPPGTSPCVVPLPPYNPFVPRLLINLDRIPGACMLTENMKVTINPIPFVTIQSAFVYKDGVNTGITLAQLQAGYTFTTPGNYEVRITYRYEGEPGNPNNPPDPPGYSTLIRDFHIASTPFPHIQRENRFYGYVNPGEAIIFNTVVEDDGTIEYNMLTGEFTLAFCGYYKIKWFVATESSSTTDGINFAIAINGQPGMIGSSHADVGEMVGFGIVKVNGAPPVITLVNVSNNDVYFSQASQVKAGIVIYKIGDVAPA